MLEKAPPGCPDFAEVTIVRAETLARFAAASREEICAGERVSTESLSSKWIAS